MTTAATQYRGLLIVKKESIHEKDVIIPESYVPKSI